MRKAHVALRPEPKPNQPLYGCPCPAAPTRLPPSFATTSSFGLSLCLPLQPDLPVFACCWTLRAGMTHASPGDNMLAVPHVSHVCSACSSDASGHSAVTQQPAVTRCSELLQDSLTRHLNESALQTKVCSGAGVQVSAGRAKPEAARRGQCARPSAGCT